MRHLVLAIAVLAASVRASAACPEILDQQMRVLGKPDTVNLCERYSGKPVLVVNTASHCGFTKQFKGLEALYQAYKDRGFVVAGFPSDDFRQEADEESETAKVCYVNYGVTFDMYSKVHVKGESAHPLFRAIAEQSEAPGWNFNKYLLDREGKVVANFGAMTSPEDGELRSAIEKVL